MNIGKFQNICFILYATIIFRNENSNMSIKWLE